MHQFLGIFGVHPIPWLVSPSLALVAVIGVNVWLGIPFNTTILYTGLQAVPEELYEAAAVAAYLVFGVPLAQAVAVALVQHACLLAAMVGPGYLLTVWRSLGRAPAT